MLFIYLIYLLNLLYNSLYYKIPFSTIAKFIEIAAFALKEFLRLSVKAINLILLHVSRGLPLQIMHRTKLEVLWIVAFSGT
jgi:hypothetical protein